MGNNHQVYTQGHFLTPNKIQKPHFAINQKALNLQNVFGKMDIPTARAQRADNTFVEEIQSTLEKRVQYYEKSERNQEVKQIKQIRIIRQKHTQSTALSEKRNRLNVPQLQLSDVRKVKTVTHSAVINHSQSGLDKYSTRKDSPVKEENANPSESQIKIFQSRFQNKYFKIAK